MNWVAPCLCEGLGNRLFQYAAAKYYSELYKKPLVFFLPRSKPTRHGGFTNIFKLFPETPILESDCSWNNFHESDYYAFESMPFIETNLVICGSRQNYKYIQDLELNPVFNFQVERLEYLNSTYLQNKEKLFSIHVRLGDFKYLPHHQINLPAYYSQALAYIPNDARVLVFSDEPDLAANLFPQYTICYENDELEVFYLLCNCLYGSIAANSTFSYWGSYFSHKKNKNHIAIFPHKLMNNDRDFSGYFPDYSIVLKF